MTPTQATSSATGAARPADRFAAAGTFVVIGASGGIGSAVAASLAGRGAAVFATSRRTGTVDGTAADNVTPWELDATDFEAVQRCLETAGDAGPALAGVVNCAGSMLLRSAHMTSAQQWHDVVATNLTTAFATVRAAGRVMGDGGSVVLCSSCAATVGLSNHEAIAAAKGGIEALVRAAAATYAPRGVRFNAVAPGLVKTPLTERITSSETALEASRRMHPLARVGEPRDVASGILWLLDPDNDWVTGQTLGIDGGLGRVRAGGPGQSEGKRR